jgi:UDP-N-acetyl-D-mannosaminuronic acid transferase (WecB/TagA/CpsF family)
LAIGSPQQEIVAHKLKERGVARGLALCVGTAVNYLTGIEKRAPQWMQRIGFEWLFRLLQNPKRLAKRYLVRGPLIFPLLFRIELRPRRLTAIPGLAEEISSRGPR